MRSTVSSLLLLAAVSVPALAQNISQTTVVDQSANFNLVIQSSNQTLNGTLLGACHNGAAHEGLCITDGSVEPSSNYVSFQFNTTRNVCTETNSTGTFPVSCNDPPVNATVGQTGGLTWWLLYGGTASPELRVSQAVSLAYNPTSNVAQVEVGFSENSGFSQYMAFDDKALLNIQNYVDDTLEPGEEYLGYSKAYYSWYICKTYYSGYRYTALTWVLGPAPPQNPTCEKVDVKRVWV